MATALAPLSRIREQLKTQNNECTAHPLFVVLNRRRIYGMDPNYGDETNCTWVETANGDYCEADEKKKLALDRYERMFDKEPEGWSKFHYIEVDEFVTCAFTREAAQNFIDHRRRGYNHLHIDVDSLYRMQEMIDVREALLAGRFQEAC